MDLLAIILYLAIIGIGLYALNQFVPMDAKIKTILNWVVIIAVLVWLFSIFAGYFPHITVGRK